MSTPASQSSITVTQVEQRAEDVVLQWSDETTARFHVLWLRDNCPADGDKEKAFRTFSVVDLDPNLTIASARHTPTTVSVSYSDGHESVFDAAWLRQHCTLVRSERPRTVTPFAAGDTLPSVSMPEPGTAGHCDLLEAVAEFGAVTVTSVPTDEAGTEALAALVGRIRETDFGRVFNIVMEPEVWTLSQSGKALDPHTDDPFRYTPSGTSLLHCVEVSTDGGDSLFVDGFAVAETLREIDPDAFELLHSVAVPFIRKRNDAVDQGEDVNMQAHAPVIALDHLGDVAGIRYHERSMAPFDLDPDIVGDYYRAFITFSRMINDPANAIQFRLHPGEAVVYDNQRVLHGRTAFSGEGGRRHLRLATIDRDQFHSRLRRLREDLGRPGVNERLPVGNLS